MHIPRKALVLVAVCCASMPGALPQTSQEDAARYAEAGQKALASGQYADALANFEQLEKIQPNIAEVHATLAAIYFKGRQYDRAVDEVQLAKKLKPSLPKLDSLLALALAELGRFHEALPQLESGFKQGADPEVRRMCGLQLLRAYTNLDRDTDAVALALKLNALYPDDPEVLYHTGRIYGNYAYVVLEKLHDQAPNSIWMLQAQGEANESQKEYESAIAAFNHVLALDPHRPGIHYRLGRLYLTRFNENGNAQDRDLATHEFNAELEVDPRSGNAAYELANLAAQSGDGEKARQGFEEVLLKFPDFEQALVGLGGLLLDSQSPREAVAPLERATKLRPDDEIAWYRLALAERAAGNRAEQQKALEEFRKLHQSTPPGLKKPTDAEEVTPQQLGAAPEP
jgi:predicted Zn-dependent protease